MVISTFLMSELLSVNISCILALHQIAVLCIVVHWSLEGKSFYFSSLLFCCIFSNSIKHSFLASFLSCRNGEF
jgi:hypothetical protein